MERANAQSEANSPGAAPAALEPAGGAGVVVLAAGAAGIDRRPAGAVRHHHHGATFGSSRDVLAKMQEEARKSGLFIFTNTDLRFDTPQIELISTMTRPTGSASPWPDIGTSLATLLGGNYVNRFNL